MTTLATRIIPSPLGAIRIAVAGGEVTEVHLGADDEDELPAQDAADRAVLDRAAAQLREYFAGTRRRFELPLARAGTPFQCGVWAKLDAIPFGARRSYGDLAKELGNPGASRAVGAANGKNPIAIIVPCHRVIGSDGSLTGYAGGEDRKRWLLDHEARVAGQQLALL
jgi:methylated-DNA-[protein]-cysteine S-methyltransferase